MQNEERQITFNDIPEVLSEILKRFDLLDQFKRTEWVFYYYC